MHITTKSPQHRSVWFKFNSFAGLQSRTGDIAFRTIMVSVCVVILDFDALLTRKWVPNFRRNVLSPSSGLESFLLVDTAPNAEPSSQQLTNTLPFRDRRWMVLELVWIWICEVLARNSNSPCAVTVTSLLKSVKEELLKLSRRLYLWFTEARVRTDPLSARFFIISWRGDEKSCKFDMTLRF
jgi:hypothetical protein